MMNDVATIGVLQAEVERLKQCVAELESERDSRQHMLDTVPNMLYIYDVQRQQNTYVNEECVRILGYDQTMIRNMGNEVLATMIHPNDVERARQYLAQFMHLQDGDVLEFEIRVRSASQETFWFFNRSVVLSRAPDGSVHTVLGSFIDITAHKQIEESLRTSEARLAHSQHIAHVGSWQWMFGVNQLYWTDEIYRIAGYEPRAFEPTIDRFLQIVHPDDRPQMLKMIDEVRNHHVTLPADHEYRMLRSDGKVRLIYSKNESVYDETGALVGVFGTIQDVTDHRLTEALRESEQRYRQFVEGTSDLVVQVDQNGRYLYVNPTAERILGLPAESCVGLLAFDFVHPDDRAHTEQAFASWILQGATTVTFENRTINHNTGTAYSLLWTINIQYDTAGALTTINAIATDISQYKELQAALRQSQILLKGVLEYSPAAIYVKDIQGTFLLVNRQATEIMQLTPDQIIGKNEADLFPPEIVEVWRENKREVIATGNPLEFEESLPREDGLHTYLSFRFPIFDPDGNIYAIGGIATDISERKQAEETLREMADHLQLANAQLARAARLKDEFLANMSHELRTPLNVVLGMSEALREGVYGDINKRQRGSLAAIEESGKHLLSMINDILDMARIEAGKETLELQPVDIASVCQSSLQFIKHTTDQKQLALHINIADNMPLLIADERRLKQILVNLLNNAVKFTPEQGQVGLAVAYHAEPHQFVLTIWDTGIGIADEHKELLFQPFVQLDSSLARAYEGTGLGLALVDRLTTLHGGRVEVESTVGKGSRFTITLPQHYAELQLVRNGSGPHTIETELTSMTGTTDARVLLAEDNELNILTIVDYLSDKGYQVIVAHTGEEVLRLARQERPHIILMDMQMPQMDGLEATRQLRSDSTLAHIPILATTALAMAGDRERCLAAGADEYLSKPIDLGQLVHLIERYVQPNTHRAQRKDNPH